MKKVNVVGYGTVGKAQEFLLRKLGHTVNVYDPYVLPESKLLVDADLTFICTRETAAEGVLENLIKEGVNGLYVVKSTVPVGTTRALIEKHKIHLCQNPEFLREKTAFEDVLDPDRIVIGQCCEEHGRLLADLYTPLGKPIYLTDIGTSELVKLTVNSYLAMLITFWNEIHELSSKLGMDTKKVAEIVCSDHRISRYGTSKFGEPFGGSCLPKDLDHLIKVFYDVGLKPSILETIKDLNQGMKNDF